MNTKLKKINLWVMRIGILGLLFTLIILFLYFRAYLPKPYIPMESPIVRYILIPLLLILGNVIRNNKKKKEEEIKGKREKSSCDSPINKGNQKEKERLFQKIGRKIIYNCFIPIYIRLWIRIYNFQNLLFKLYPNFFLKLMYISHRLFSEYISLWGKRGENSKKYYIFYDLICGEICKCILYLFLIVDITIYKGFHMIFYSYVFSFLYFSLFEYLLFMARRYEDLILNAPTPYPFLNR